MTDIIPILAPGRFIATKEHPSSDGCFVTYWGCEISSPKLSIEEMGVIFGHDDSGITFIGDVGRLRKLSCRWLSSLEPDVHFRVLLAQLPSALEMLRLKERYNLKIEFYRFWLGRSGSQAPKVGDSILTTIRAFGGEFEDVVEAVSENAAAGTANVSFIVSGKALNADELTSFFGLPTREIKPTDIIGRRRALQVGMHPQKIVNLTRNRAVWRIDSNKLTTSENWHDVLWSVFNYLKPPPSNWSTYLLENGLNAEFMATWVGDDGATEPILTDEEFARICAYHAQWNLTPVYADGPESGWY